MWSFQRQTQSPATPSGPREATATASCQADLDDLATALAVQCTHDVPAPEAATVDPEPALAR